MDFKSLNEQLSKFIESNLPEFQKMDKICDLDKHLSESGRYIGMKDSKYGIYKYTRTTQKFNGSWNYDYKLISPEFDEVLDAIDWLAQDLLSNNTKEDLEDCIKEGSFKIYDDNLKTILDINTEEGTLNTNPKFPTGDNKGIDTLPNYMLEPNKAKSNNLRRDYIQAHGKEYQESLNEDTGMYGGFYKEELKLIDKLTDLIQTPAIVEHKSLITDRIELELDKEICGYGARFTIYNHITNENSDGSGVYHVMIDLHNFMPKQMPYEMKEILDELPLRMKDSYYIINEDTEDLESIPQKAADIINDILVKLNNIVKDDEYKPYQVMNKDTGDVWEFSDLKDAKAKETEEREKDFHADLRTAKVNKSGEFVKWV